MKSKFFCVVTGICCGMALSLTACSGSSTSTEAAVEEISFDMSQSHGSGAFSPAPAGEMTGGEMNAVSEAVGVSGSVSGSVSEDRKLIRTATLFVETDSFDSLLELLPQQAADLGGYVEQSEVSGNSMHQNRPVPRYASLTIRIPSNQLDSFLTIVEEHSNVTSHSESTQDITLQYSDLESRKKSLTVEQERLWELLDQADSLDSVIALEERLSEIRYQLESLESQMRIYDNQTSYSTVYLDIQELAQGDGFTPTEPETFLHRVQNGLSRNLKSLKEGAVSLLVAVITLSPFWLPLLILAAAVFWLIRRTSRRKKDISEPQQDKGDPNAH